MEPLSLIYWIKFCLGALVAVLCLLLQVDNIFTSITIGIFVYVISDKLLKQIFIAKVEKPSVVTKTGIGIYIIAWFFFWILLYTIAYWYSLV